MTQNKDSVAMQTRCLHCLAEQYAMNVFSVSMGESACSFCGEKSEQMDQKEYNKRLYEAKEKAK